MPTVIRKRSERQRSITEKDKIVTYVGASGNKRVMRTK